MPTKLTNDEATWLRTNKETTERRNRLLKGMGVFIFCFAIAFVLVLTFTTTSTLSYPNTPTSIFATLAALVFFATLAALVIIFDNEEYKTAKISGILSGLVVGLILINTYISPSLQMVAYPMQLQVAYPHLTIIQNCTAFSLSAQGYLNGQLINPANTTTCLLPQENNTEYQCSIANKSITCVSGSSAWSGSILNVSKR